MVERDERKGEEAPEDEGVREAGKRALANDLGLAEHLPEEVPYPLADGSEVEVGVFAGGEDVAQDAVEAPEETDERQAR